VGPDALATITSLGDDHQFAHDGHYSLGGRVRRLWSELKVEADVEPRHVTIVEVRPPWDGVGEHTRFPVARLRYTATTGQWAIYWRDRHLKFHEYKRKRPTKNVQALLDYIEDSGDPIFWGSDLGWARMERWMMARG
jgi:hypothetical protein